jgi:tetratricopeptide (TPR) repeat protein
VFGFLQTHEFPNPKRFALPLIVLLVSVLLFFLPSPLKLNLTIVVSPSYKTSIDITKSALGTNSMQLLFGSGPGTFLHDYLAYKPAAVNASPFWSLSFDRAKSFVITMFATLGVVGSALWLLLMVWIAIKALGRLVFEKDHQEWKMTYVMFIGWAILLISHILYSSNFTMQFMLWGFTGLLASQVISKIWKTDFSRSPKLGLTASFVFVVLSVAMLGSLFVTGQRYAAEVSFAKAIELDSNGAPVERVIAELNQAVKLNGLSDVYYRNLASAQLSQVRQHVASYNGAELTPEQTQKIADLVSNAIKSGSRATEIEPNYVANWVIRGSIYRDLMSFAQGAEDLAAQMFLNAIRIEPTNPVHRTNLGRVYVTVADRARVLKSAESEELAKTAAEQEAGLLQTAEQAFATAVQLKPDYAPAHYYLAAVHERQGKLSDSVTRLAALRNNNLTDIGLAFQLSQMLIRLQKFDLATQELERIVGLSPEYSNALWYLASMYEIQGRQGEAIQLVAKVVNKNPQNQVARTRLNRMQAGEITTVIPELIQQGQGVPTMVPRGEVVKPVPAEEGVSEVSENPEEPTEGGADEVSENPEEVVEQNPEEPTE